MLLCRRANLKKFDKIFFKNVCMIFALKKEKKYNFRNTFFRYDRVITRLQPASMVFKNIFFISGSKIQKYNLFVAKNNTYVKQQQSKPLIESLENRVFSEFQPDALASFCRSWYEYTAALVAFFPCLVIFSISQLKFLFYNFWYFAIFLFTFIDDFFVRNYILWTLATFEHGKPYM